MKKNKNGFTLIELLAIIVILAIIAVITVPIILNVIENARKGAIQDSVYGYKDAINKYYVTKLQEQPNYVFTGTYDVKELKNMGVSVSGQEPSNGWVKLDKGQIIDYSLKIGEYTTSFDTATKENLTNKNGDLKTSPTDWFIYINDDATKTAKITGFNETNYDSNVTDIIIPLVSDKNYKVTSITNNAFQNSNITSVVISNNIEEITSGAFAHCNNLQNIVFNNDNDLTLSYGAFQNLNMEYIYIPQNVIISHSTVFQGSKLKKMYIDTKEILTLTCTACSELEEVILGDNVEIIGNSALYIPKLATLTIGKNVNSIASASIGAIGPSALQVYNRSSINLKEGNYFGGMSGYKIYNYDYETNKYIETE